MLFQEDAYVRRLMIFHHLVECADLYRKHMHKEIPWEDVQRELADLYILIEADVPSELYEKRFYKFEEKDKDRSSESDFAWYVGKMSDNQT